jgi:multiple sugar transport system permease protein
MMARKRRHSLRKMTQRLVSYSILILVTCLISLPVVWLLVTSLKREVEYMAYPIKFLPEVPQWDNYVSVFTMGGFSYARVARNTAFLSLTYAILAVITSSMAGFAFSRFRVPGRDRLFMIVIALLIVPSIVTIIPQFIVFARLHLTNTYWPWILWGLTASPFHIFLFRQFFASFPKELEDAAEVDGCGPFRTFWQIFLPNAKPALATSFIFNFGGVWGDYFNPLIFLSEAQTTLAVKLSTAYADPVGNRLTTITLAASVVYVVPLVILFFLGQKHILKGAVLSGLKG